MDAEKVQSRRMVGLFYRSVWLPAIVAIALLLIALGLLLNMSWRTLLRLEPVDSHRVVVTRVEEMGLHLEGMLIGNGRISAQDVQRLRKEIAGIAALNTSLTPATPGRLKEIQRLLADMGDHPKANVIDALGLMRAILSSESRAQDRLLGRVYGDTRLELEVTTGIMVALPVLALLAIFFLRHRILLPLNNLRSLMTMLSQQDYSPTPTRDVDPLLRPLFENYNQLAQRLAELEQARQARQQLLENEVRAASRALLEQQRNLANAERLAAVGEVAAGLAHELRNPLAGIHMALGNLRREITGGDQAERLDLAIVELKRVTRLLNDLLSQGRQSPEPTREIVLAAVVEELLALARYQLPAHVRLEHAVPQGLRCRVPEGRLRQALLNLVLNSAQALGDRPGAITIAAHQLDGELRLSVHDDGPGFPAELLETGVRAFATGREHGIGLGLAMVRRFARDMGGDLALANRDPRGASCTLALPCKEPNHG